MSGVRRQERLFPVVAAIIAASVTAFYWYVITGQGDEHEQRPRLVAAGLVLATFSILLSTVVPKAVLRLSLLSLGSSMLVIWTLAGAMSIGVLLLPAAMIGLHATGRTSDLVSTRSAWTAVTAGAAASLILAFIVFAS